MRGSSRWTLILGRINRAGVKNALSVLNDQRVIYKSRGKSSHRTPAVGLTGGPRVNVDTDVSFLGMQCISVQPFRKKKKKKMLRVKPQLALECFGRSLESV